jgi:hypothetical protein
MARAPVSKTGGWGFESLHSCQPEKNAPSTLRGRRNGVDRHLGHARLIGGAGRNQFPKPARVNGWPYFVTRNVK